jgi:hypothetical protein
MRLRYRTQLIPIGGMALVIAYAAWKVIELAA